MFICSNMEEALRNVMSFETFYIHCQHDGARLRSLEDVSLHIHQQKHDKRKICMICGECGGVYSDMRELTNHVNNKGFKVRRSKIRHYEMNKFDPSKPYSIVDHNGIKEMLPPNPPVELPKSTKQRRTTSTESKKKAAAAERKRKAAEISQPHSIQDEIVPAFDTHYSYPALQARCELGIQSSLHPLEFQASPQFPTLRHLYSFHSIPGLPLPKIPLTNTPRHHISVIHELKTPKVPLTDDDIAWADTVEPDEVPPLPSAQATHAKPETVPSQPLPDQLSPMGDIISLNSTPILGASPYLTSTVPATVPTTSTFTVFHMPDAHTFFSFSQTKEPTASHTISVPPPDTSPQVTTSSAMMNTSAPYEEQQISPPPLIHTFATSTPPNSPTPVVTATAAISTETVTTSSPNQPYQALPTCPTQIPVTSIISTPLAPRPFTFQAPFQMPPPPLSSRSSVICFQPRVIQSTPIRPSLRPPMIQQAGASQVPCLIQHLNWLIRLLTAALSEHPDVSPAVRAFDQLEREDIVRSSLWPHNLPADADLPVVLLRLKHEYDSILRRAPSF